MKRIKILLIAAGLLTAFVASAQSQGQMRLNEYLVINTNDYQDDFGQQSAWIEIFNASYGTVDIGGCYLSDDPDNLTKYAIPGGDILTKIPPRQHVIFWADNQPFRGTFHTNFDLMDADEIIFTKGDGSSIIDRIKVEKCLKDSTLANVSFGRTQDGEGSIDGEGEGWAVLERTSPSTNNAMIDKASKPQKMKEMDPYGWMMAVLAMSVVFIALIILYFIFKQIGKLNIRNAAKQAEKDKPAVQKIAAKPGKKDESGETFAAIAMALNLWIEENEAHDDESYVLTIDRVKSAWNAIDQMLLKVPEIKK